MNEKKLSMTMLSLLLAASMLLSSCGGADYKTIDKKIEENGVLANFTEQEYGAMLDNCEKWVERLSGILNSSNLTFEEMGKEMEKEMEESSQSLLYLAALSQAMEEGKLNKSNLKRFKSIRNQFDSLIEQMNSYSASQYDEYGY